MMNKITGHYSQSYDDELNEAVDRLLTMGALVEQQLRDAIKAFIKGDRDLALEVIQTDRTVNTQEIGIEEHCLEIIARRQPAARDLRLIVGVLKSINDVERIGDQAEHIAKQLLDEDCQRPTEAQLEDIEMMGDKVLQMLQQSLSAFKEMDAALALAVLKQDKLVDHDYGRILRHNLTYMLEDTRQITRGLHLIWVARALERIGDHAQNICEFSIFIAKGQNVSHLSEEEVEAVVDKGRK
ncbi:phosphate signaling complex protein PhoU [Alkalimonas delamerensis]|uniref:Phosphate-specific transport system accessory protein PhoU n=1 Tax=Alkalimonas delamerensis TaxID=265981 RepID=A0ABT9GQJ2_9GAMM|nr:phosphate signaling complex protein PhoU [Alkalimonas delamerensis]MDP4529247.1 phosphate signaling complex protein PhoU [Alkalimonas delamerensis]